MKKYISLLLATAATIACTKVALEDNSPIESLPQEGNTENIQGEPSGEKIIISLAETKVSLDGEGYYQFDGDEVIYVQASSTKAVAKLQNSAAKPTTFTGEFNGLLGETSETFDFYYNCTDENANVVTDENGNVVVVKVQNGQPWLAAIGVDGYRSEASEYSYELNNVMLKQLDGYVCLALNSDYPCTVDFHTLSTKLPKTTITGIQLGSESKKPYFVNVSKGLTGGFYLAVNKTGETGTMYTSYATATTISKNTTIKIKDFTPLSITGELSGFNTSYSIYTDSSNLNRVAEANSVSNDYMSGGSLTLRIAGISNSLLSLVSLESITIGSSDKKNLGSSTRKPEWSNKEYTWDFNESSHTTWGELTITATAVFITPAGKVTAEVPALSRHITGLPYTAAPPTKSGSYPWKATKGTTNIKWNSGEVVLNAALTTSGDLKPLIQSSDFYLPNNESINVAATVGYRLRASSSKVTTTFAMWISGVEVYKNSTSSTKEIGSDSQSINNDKCILTSSKKYIEFESYRTNILSSIADNYAKLKSVRLEYR